MENKTAFSRKPQRDRVREADVFAVIDKGGSSATGDRPGSPPKDRAMNLRIPAHLAQQMDAALRARTVRISKNTWILEAIAEKAQRELAP
jgi:predicted HicB family RNase H-like nuclease